MAFYGPRMWHAINANNLKQQKLLIVLSEKKDALVPTQKTKYQKLPAIAFMSLGIHLEESLHTEIYIGYEVSLGSITEERSLFSVHY